MQQATRPGTGSDQGRVFSLLQLAAVVALHAAAFAALVATDVNALATQPSTILVRTIASEPLAIAPAPAPEAPRKPAAAKPTLRHRAAPTSPRPLLTRPFEAAAAPNAPQLPQPAAAAPNPASTATAAEPPAPVVAAPPVVSDPRFDASYLDNPAPAYPALSRRLGEEGRVVLRVFVQADGRPASVEVKAGSGSPRLDEAALDAVRRWKFLPGRRGAEAVAGWVLVPIAFHLKG